MELFLFQHNEYERLYNCSEIIIDSIPLEKRQLTTLALINLILSTIYFLLYLPCLYSIWKQHWKNDCYTILLYLSFVDIFALLIIGFIHSWLALHGAVFCSFPKIIYIVGSISLSLWIAESTADIILAINRCLYVIFPSIAEFLFKGIRINIWLLICSLYALYWLFFAKPVIFSGIYFAWFFFPFVGYKNDTNQEFVYKLHNFHDLSVAILSPGIYLLFALSLAVKNRALKIENATNENSTVSFSRAEKLTFIQVFIISLINTICGSFYVLMQHLIPQQWLITLAQFSWLHIHGFPPVIYLTLNKTIRNDCRQLFNKYFRKNQVSNINGAEMILH